MVDISIDCEVSWKRFYLGNFFLVTVCYSDRVRFSVINNMMAALISIENEM